MNYTFQELACICVTVKQAMSQKPNVFINNFIQTERRYLFKNRLKIVRYQNVKKQKIQ